VNNAGIAIDGLLLRTKKEDWARTLDVNLSGAFYCVKAASRYLLKAQDGRVVNISSVVGESGNAGQVSYAAAKAGLIGMTKSLAAEVASRNITCNAVAPGFIATAMTDALTDAQKEMISQRIPAGRMGNPSEIASAVVYLASEEAAYVTGATLQVNGGMAMI